MRSVRVARSIRLIQIATRKTIVLPLVMNGSPRQQVFALARFASWIRPAKTCFAFEVITVYPAIDSNGELKKMKARGFVVTLFAVAFAFAPQLLKTSTAAPDAQQGTYAAKLVSPQAGDVVFPGEKVRVVWEALFPKLPVNLSWCETEIWLSLDGGKSFPFIITPIHFDPNFRIGSFDWTVWNTPTAAAVLDIRFGCEEYFPETRSVQTASSFVIGQSAGY